MRIERCWADETGAEASPQLLTVAGEVERSLKLTTADLARLPRKSVVARDHDEKESSFEGVELREVLKLAGVKFGESLRGKNLVLYLLVEASDGYQAVFALPELDDAFRDRVILIAERRDNKYLSPSAVLARFKGGLREQPSMTKTLCASPNRPAEYERME